ncbi:MAG: 2-hydroxyacyl-CoA dehydratase family protein [Candidatus Hydrogenedentes bacterium]|nr:2-hydroxyacyl-CoA dehydratase family protein [Candidatus Hydrogenedentota bacterium]
MTFSGVEGLAPFEAVCAEPLALPRRMAAGGRRVAGHMCTYTPEELLHAAGMAPVRLLGWTDTTHRADGLIQAYACSLARAVLDLALSGQLDFLDTMVFSHTCDTIQNLADIWKLNLPGMDVITLSTPVDVGSPHAVRFYRSELARARRQLETRVGPISDGAIVDAIDLYSTHRAEMRRLYAMRREHPGLIGASAVQTVALASFVMPRDEHLELLRQLVGELSRVKSNGPASSVPRVFVAGAACQQPDLLEVIEEAECVVVGDDLCTGERGFSVERVDAGDPLESLARMYLGRRPCASKHLAGHNYAKWLLNTSRDSGADGVVLLFTKFCDPWAFEYPGLRAEFDAAGVPLLLLEVEQHMPPTAQFETRVAAFAEIVGAARKERQG